VIIEGALVGVASGSMVLFALLFVSSLVAGRAWWLVALPTGRLLEITAAATGRWS
jgi:hypothetical protein